MEKRRPKAGTVVMIALLLALIGVCVYLAPRTRDAYQEYRTESEATPTPTADNANMMAVTLDPKATPTPTMLILKLGTQFLAAGDFSLSEFSVPIENSWKYETKQDSSVITFDAARNVQALHEYIYGEYIPAAAE